MRGPPRWPTLFSRGLYFCGPSDAFTRSSAQSAGGGMGLIMRRIQRIEKLERRVERIFFGITMALLIFVLLCILIVARKSFGTSQVNSGNLPSQSHG
jgi:pilus assembly protein TadC